MNHPYASQRSQAFWKSAVSEVSPLEFAGIYTPKYPLTKEMPIAAAGSCFAQHIARQFKQRGFKLRQVEPAPEFLTAEQRESFGFEIYSARYGNVYSIRQLLQLFRRAAGDFTPSETIWKNDERYYDPFRPSIEPGGFSTQRELERDRAFHLSRVNRLLASTQLFVFTFGLTEAWLCREDGAVLPSCPGTIAGSFDSQRYEFHNFNYDEVLSDAEEFIALALNQNPGMQFLFTVSPVPLTATAGELHVLQASVYSKSVLRAVCGVLYEKYPQVDYFPSYELVASHPMRAMFFQPNLRTVTSAGVEHVMKIFFGAHGFSDSASVGQGRARAQTNRFMDDDVICDEEVLESVAP